MAYPHRSIPPLKAKDIERFWVKAKRGKTDECWEWTASKSSRGYGEFSCGSRTDSSCGIFLAHRVAWRIVHGPIPNGLCVLHHCDNRACVNPRHLFLGTLADNNHDMFRKGRGACGDKNGMRKYPECRPHGERNGRAKFTEQAIRGIRCRAAEGVPQRVLAQENGVTQSAISMIVHRKRWNHV